MGNTAGNPNGAWRLHSQDGGQILVCHAVFQITNACTPPVCPCCFMGHPSNGPACAAFTAYRSKKLPAMACVFLHGAGRFPFHAVLALTLLHDAAVVSVRVLASLIAAGSLAH